MHLLKGNYGIPGAGSQESALGAGLPAGARPSIGEGVGSRALASKHSTSTHSRPWQVAPDSDDIDHILQQVRQGVAAVQNAASSLQRDQASMGGSSGSTDCYSREKIAKRDNPATEFEEDAPRPVIKTTLRGRYVFNTNADSQVLIAPHGHHADLPSPRPSYGLAGCGMGDLTGRRPGPRTRGKRGAAEMGGVGGGSTHAAAEAAMAAECVDAIDIFNSLDLENMG
ncbi:unnamed protein product [Polarella glacialis]|uniref:Uncharacterized protein n=1 Tax=Polarella glacialis TaxID=89957 RepID=A0A813IIX1_POLGL|nr:unnamed protein product [Polarella glacialis]CAE8653942.1 unnamed protein product [Polarella glacialis]